MLIVENISGTINGMNAARKKPGPLPLMSAWGGTMGIRSDTAITLGWL